MSRQTNHDPKIGRLLAAIALGALLLGLAASGPALAEPDMSDTSIADAVEDELAYDQSVPLNDIDVRVTKGVVTLTGSVNNLLAKERAARLAQTVKGVRSVINRIDVSPYWGRMDWEIERDVEDAMVFDLATESYEVEAEVIDHVAYLTGTVDSWREKMLAEKVVKGVRGVTDVTNNLTVSYPEERPDFEMKEEIDSALRWDTLVDDRWIIVAVNNGKVTLDGRVGSAAERRQARYDAWVYGVHSVDTSDLTVDPNLRDEAQRESKYVIKSEDEVKEAVEDALIYDPRVLSFDINVDVVGNVVTLRGEVDNLKAKRAAAQVARNTIGVAAVKNRIKVRPETYLDEDIARNIRNAIARDPYLERFEIDVSVIDGTAYLSGTVDSYFEKGRAEDVAARAGGVTAVRNSLDVDYPGYSIAYDPFVFDYYPYDYDWYDYVPYATFYSDEEIEREIEDELWWSPFVDADDVEVSVEDGVATLTGTVDSWSERSDATENAYEGGAVWVENHLMVE